MSVSLFVTVLIICVTMSSSVILLKFWMDFKINVWDREKGYLKNLRRDTVIKKAHVHNSCDPRRKINKFFSNKKSKKDIIIDCKAEVINEILDRETIDVKRRIN